MLTAITRQRSGANGVGQTISGTGTGSKSTQKTQNFTQAVPSDSALGMGTHYVTDLMAKHRRQFIFIIKEGQNAASDKDICVRRSPRINNRLIHHHKGIGAACMRRHRK